MAFNPAANANPATVGPDGRPCSWHHPTLPLRIVLGSVAAKEKTEDPASAASNPWISVAWAWRVEKADGTVLKDGLESNVLRAMEACHYWILGRQFPDGGTLEHSKQERRRYILAKLALWQMEYERGIRFLRRKDCATRAPALARIYASRLQALEIEAKFLGVTTGKDVKDPSRLPEETDGYFDEGEEDAEPGGPDEEPADGRGMVPPVPAREAEETPGAQGGGEGGELSRVPSPQRVSAGNAGWQNEPDEAGPDAISSGGLSYGGPPMP